MNEGFSCREREKRAKAGDVSGVVEAVFVTVLMCLEKVRELSKMTPSLWQ